MAVKQIPIAEFWELRRKHHVLDVRSPGEYSHAHMPGAVSLPLFTDEERKVVGTAYKQESREQAVKIGLDYFGAKMRAMVEQAEQIMQERTDKTILVHCWRGGMRSAGVAWLLDLYGFRVLTLSGGYKAYRTMARAQFEVDYPFSVIGGYTGSGKTLVLQELRKAGQKVIDLEDLAKHKGSAFGAIAGVVAPTQEMFENLLAEELYEIKKQPPTGDTIWLEDESQRIGGINLPNAFWNIMRRAPVCFLEIPFEERLKHIVEEYGKQDKVQLQNAIIRIQKRLGPLETKTTLEYLAQDNVTESFRILLKYYDKQYNKALQKRGNADMPVDKITCEHVDGQVNSKKIIAWKKEVK
jgi:tRNA 2-selenouridine synthase